MNQLDHPHKVSFSHLGIKGVDGAHKIFSELESRKPGTITSLRVAHNSLGDAGAVALFDFLAQADGDAYPLQALELEHCRIGNGSLRAIAGYLLGNTRLGRLTLHDDGITGDDEAGTVLFAEAINSSRLRHLTLSTNTLTDAFATPFFSTLTSRTLSSLCMNGVGFTSSILAVHLASSTSPQYDIISLSGHSLSRPGVSAIIDALSEHQFWLTHLHIPGLWKAPKGEKPWTDEWAKLKRIYTRNLRLKPAIRDQARSLLRCARAIFLRPLASPTLPAELVLLTMVHLSPLLSYKQRERVLDYARDSSTLPPTYAQVPLASQAKERERFFVCVGCD